MRLTGVEGKRATLENRKSSFIPGTVIALYAFILRNYLVLSFKKTHISPLPHWPLKLEIFDILRYLLHIISGQQKVT